MNGHMKNSIRHTAARKGLRLQAALDISAGIRDIDVFCEPLMLLAAIYKTFEHPA